MGFEGKQPEEFADHVRELLEEEQKGKADDEVFGRNFATRAFKPTDPRTKYILWKLSAPTGETFLNIGEIQRA